MFNLTVLGKMAKFFVIYFVIYYIVSYFIRSGEEAFYSFGSFSKKVVFASFMAMFFVMFDGRLFNRHEAGERKPGAMRTFDLKHILNGILMFLLFCVPLILVLYFIFSRYYHEKIDLLKEFMILGVYTLILTILILLFGWIMSRRDKARGNNH